MPLSSKPLAPHTARDRLADGRSPSIRELERRASEAERESPQLCAAYRRLVLERRVGPMPEPPRGDELAGEIKDLSF